MEVEAEGGEGAANVVQLQTDQFVWRVCDICDSSYTLQYLFTLVKSVVIVTFETIQ